jgi:hypothetical protein
MTLAAGARLGSYEIVAPLGAGGMGEVYRARHLRLGREVAIKVLPEEVASDPERLQRFEREARAASALNHPNIVTIHDIDEHDGTPYIAMELVDGRTLRAILNEGRMPFARVLSIARQLADGLAKAHAAGIIHRDLKPENVMLTGDGLVKVLDFGLARLTPESTTASEMTTSSAITRQGVLTGTVQYLSPEQISGRPADHRSDQFAFGVVLYEMVCAGLPFKGPTPAAVLGSILRDTPPAPRSLRPETRRELDGLVMRCLEKEPDRRYASMTEIGLAIGQCEERLTMAAAGRGGVTLRRPVVMAVVLGLVAILAVATWLWRRGARVRWARGEALSEITQLTDEGRIYDAYKLGLEARNLIPDDVRLQEVLNRITLPMQVVTRPAGARVEVKGYGEPNGPWMSIGETPLQMPIPYALMRWRISKAGYETFEGAPFGGGTLRAFASGFPLRRAGEVPAGMVWVPGGEVVHRFLPDARVTDYFLDRFEVTNRQYKTFVDGGGYTVSRYWPHQFLDDGRVLSWDEAMSRFRDTTGRPGPAGWELGTYPPDRGDHPVGGLSWYEAAAYCAFVGDSLPTVYHWYNATHQDQFSDIVRLSNFGPGGSVPVGSTSALGDYGTYDMAGNVKEWTWNATSEGRRYILGGSWGEPSYQFTQLDAQDPFERQANYGVRCARYPAPPDENLLGSVEPDYDLAERTPVGEDVFEAYRGLYAYDHTDLAAKVESVDDSSSYWRKETVSFAAAYGGERVTALIFLPRNASPPFQTVVWFPGSDVRGRPSSKVLASAFLFDFIPRSGRALVYPIYKGMYERRPPGPPGSPGPQPPGEWRDTVLYWYKDLGRTLDYLETREDIDAGRFAYYGVSTGFYGPVFTAVDRRFKASVLLAAGLPPAHMLPEMDPVNFAPRSRVPTLMLNGRDDFIFPVDICQNPLFRLLGAPAADKRHVLLDGGHIPPDRRAIIREVLGWLDKYLGPVGAPG